MKNYVVGFAYSEDLKNILLIRKNRPPWQKGLLNGVEGKIKEKSNTPQIFDEIPLTAMKRECKEETGLHLIWNMGGHMSGVNEDESVFQCWIFYAYDDRIYDFQQIEDEVLELFPMDKVPLDQVIPNLHYLIPFGIHRTSSHYYNKRDAFITITY